MTKEELVSYFKSGYKLAISHIDVFIFAFILPYFFNTLTVNTRLGQSFLFVMSGLFLTYATFFSVPALLHKNRRTVTEYINTIVQSLRRIFLPGILLFFVLGLTLMIIAGPIIRVSPLLFANRLFSATFYLSVLISALFGFTAYFFAIKKESLYVSLWHSAVASFKHSPYVIFIVVLKLAPLSITMLHLPLNSVWGGLSFVFNSVYLFYLTCTTYSYFRKNIL